MEGQKGKRRLHLFCNAHIDIIWQWTMEEAISATLSTFRVAAEMCEQDKGLIFNHNEALLYQWVEEYDPGLFARIQKLVKAGHWHIMGGWTLQPDCLMPTGESLVRQMLYGRSYFLEKFGRVPETALNLDSFGHAQGMVQIMQQAGFKNYLFMRPEQSRMDLPQLFTWRGYDDDSAITAFRLNAPYSTLMGKSAQSIRAYLAENPHSPVNLRGWGIGNHGGGPSRQDLEDINRLIEESAGEVDILHSTPDAFFREVEREGLPEVREDLIPSWVGVYTSLSEIKQLHRKLEAKLVSAEKLSLLAQKVAGVPYPMKQLKEAYRCLAIIQFHDVLPGSCSRMAEQEAVRVAQYALELAERIHTKAMFALTASEPAAENGAIPLFVWNPHPYPVEDPAECECMLADQNWEMTHTALRAYIEGREIPCQIVKEEGNNYTLDWRKRVVIRYPFRPMGLTRMDLVPYTTEKPVFAPVEGGTFRFDNGAMSFVMNCATGLVDSFRVADRELVKAGAFALEVFADTADPWRVDVIAIDEKIGQFTLVDDREAARVCGVQDPAFRNIRVIEDGPVYTRLEAIFGYANSRARMLYTLPKQGTDFSLDITTFFLDKDLCLRLSVPTNMEKPQFRGQGVFGEKVLYDDGTESQAQRWISVQEKGMALVLVNTQSYGACCTGSVMRQTLLRSSAYAGHPLPYTQFVDFNPDLPQRPFMEFNRYLPRAEQGERNLRFRVLGVPEEERIARAEHFAAVENEKLLTYNIFPKGPGGTQTSLVRISDSRIRISALKMAEDGNGWILRLYNPQNETVSTEITAPLIGVTATVVLGHHKVETYRLTEGSLCPCPLLS